MPQLPPQLGGGSSDVLTDGLVWAALGVDPARLRGELIVQSASQQAAQAFAEHLPKMLEQVYANVPGIQTRISQATFAAMLGLIKPQVNGDRISLQIGGLEQTSNNLRLLALATGAIEEEMRRRTNVNRFNQILLAMHNYYDVHRMFPPRDEDRDASGRSKLSWRVHILPFVEENELFQQFHLDEPWDSPHNKPLLEKMPDVYRRDVFDLRPDPEIKRGYTTFLAPVGNDTVFGGAKATRFGDIRDGTSNTIVLVEVKPEFAVPWTAPGDYAFDPERARQGTADRGRWSILVRYG